MKILLWHEFTHLHSKQISPLQRELGLSPLRETKLEENVFF